MKRSKQKRGRAQVGATAGGIARSKLSATIIAIARPWIERLGAHPPMPAVEFAYQTCGVVWNATRLEDTIAREDAVRQLRESVVSAAPKGTETEVRQLFNMVYQRALATSPEDRRMVVNLAVVNLGGGSFRVDVASVAGGTEA